MSAMTRGTQHLLPAIAHRESHFESRARSEYLEMPGLRLTPEQAARLWSMDRANCALLLDGLALSGFLRCDTNGRYTLDTGGY